MCAESCESLQRETDLRDNMAVCCWFVSILCPLKGQTCGIQIKKRWNIPSIGGSSFLTSDLIAPECSIVTVTCIGRAEERLAALLSHTMTAHRGLYATWQHPVKLSVSIHPSHHSPIGGTQRWCCSLLYEILCSLGGLKAVPDNTNSDRNTAPLTESLPVFLMGWHTAPQRSFLIWFTDTAKWEWLQ